MVADGRARLRDTLRHFPRDRSPRRSCGAECHSQSITNGVSRRQTLRVRGTRTANRVGASKGKRSFATHAPSAFAKKTGAVAASRTKKDMSNEKLCWRVSMNFVVSHNQTDNTDRCTRGSGAGFVAGTFKSTARNLRLGSRQLLLEASTTGIRTTAAPAPSKRHAQFRPLGASCPGRSPLPCVGSVGPSQSQHHLRTTAASWHPRSVAAHSPVPRDRAPIRLLLSVGMLPTGGAWCFPFRGTTTAVTSGLNRATGAASASMVGPGYRAPR